MNHLIVVADAPLNIGPLSIPTELLIVLIIMVFVFGSRLMKTLTLHQQRMAEIMRPQGGQLESSEIQALRHEIDVLKATVNQQAILIDSLTNQQKQLAESLKPADTLTQRLKSD